jgi:hypothetical protein
VKFSEANYVVALAVDKHSTYYQHKIVSFKEAKELLASLRC